MIDQLIISGKGSNDEFEASVKERKIKNGKKKEIKDTVPFSNMTYDFSAINGEVYWNEKTLEYIFEIIANSAEELEEKKFKFKTWIMNVMEGEICDPFIKNYHFIGSFKDIDFDDSEVEKSTVSVGFSAYPYMIANEKTTYSLPLSLTDSVAIVVKNNSSHRITPTFISDVPVTIYVNSDTDSYSMEAGTVTPNNIKLEMGTNVITAEAASENGTLNIEFFEEVF